MTTWNDYHMGFARLAATKSKDSAQVGAVLVGFNNANLLTGYNGPPVGVEDREERRARPIKYQFASHAEQNLVAFAAREGIRTRGCTVYVTHLPCASCTRSLIQAGIAKVVYGDGEFKALADEQAAVMAMLSEAGVELVQYEPDADCLVRSWEFKKTDERVEKFDAMIDGVKHRVEIVTEPLEEQIIKSGDYVTATITADSVTIESINEPIPVNYCFSPNAKRFYSIATSVPAGDEFTAKWWLRRSEFHQSDWTHSFEGVLKTIAIPQGVYWNPISGNFYNTEHKGMGHEFYLAWYNNRENFPHQATDVSKIIPSSVWWCDINHDFYARGFAPNPVSKMSSDFRHRWHSRRHEFPNTPH